MRFIRWTYPKLERVFPGLAHKMAFELFFTPLRYKRPQREARAYEQAKKTKEIVAGKKTVFYSWGNPNDPVVLLVHGWMGRATQFHEIIDKLVQNGYQVIGFDAPGHGDSKGYKTDIREFLQAIRSIEVKFGAIRGAIGHSFGGAALIYAMHHGVRIQKLIMIASPTIGIKIVESYAKLINGSRQTVSGFLSLVQKNFNLSFEEAAASQLAKSMDLKHCLLYTSDAADD